MNINFKQQRSVKITVPGLVLRYFRTKGVLTLTLNEGCFRKFQILFSLDLVCFYFLRALMIIYLNRLYKK
jgi:hypothetical protein